MSQYTDEFITGLKRAILGANQDLFYVSSNTVKELELPNKAELILMYGERDTRRSMDPLEFVHEATWCYCKLENSPSSQIYQISTASNLLVDNNRHKAIQYSNICGPEPTADHFSDMLQLAYKLEPSEIITVVNLHGSGASIPQHFHTQIWPLSFLHNTQGKQNSIALLLNNIRLDLSRSTSLHDQYIHIKEVTFPVWGLQIEFAQDTYTPEKIGRMLYEAIHYKVRYESQLHLSYNLYIKSTQPNVVTVLFREVGKERPFQTPEIYDLITEITNLETAARIRSSDNARWRWGWLECIGGLPARDDSFACTDIFDSEFWEGVYDFMTLDKKYRCAIWHQVEKGLTDGENSLIQ